jgi:GDSL-like Lipase/Acylhydrolase family
MFRVTATCLLTLTALGALRDVCAQERATKSPPQDKARLPRVLILGDSISLGYTESVKKHLNGKAEVSRPNENCQHTGHGLVRIKTWLGDGKWDVIHFNWGIWDTHMLDTQNRLVRDETKGDLHIRHTPKQYRENLTKLVETMEKTGAKLIWGSTTPIMSRQGQRFEDIKKLNTVAEEVMKERKVAINDLYSHVLPNVKEWQSGDKVHFNAKGSDQLGKRVSERIVEVLQQGK